MAIKFNRSQTFATGGTVTAADLHNLVDGTDIYPALITDQGNLSTVSTADKLLIADVDDTVNAKSTTVQNLFDDALSGGTYTSAAVSGQLSYGTATGNRTVSTSATITTGTIPNLTAGTTTGTAASFTSGTLTTGLIQTGTFGTTTSTAAAITTGTIPNLTIGSTTATAGTVTSLTSSTASITTGTITKLTTTLAGDFTISGGTGTLGTTGVTAGTYGTNTSAVTLTLDAKGRVTTVSTSAISSTPEDGSITYAKLSTSGTESDNVAKRTAKAWVNFNGTGTVSIRDDFNVSSITDNGTGNYTMNFSSALPDTNYMAIHQGGNAAGNKIDMRTNGFQDSTASTSAFKILFYNTDTNGLIDVDYGRAIIFSS